MDWKSRIVAEPEVMLGKPCIRGTRISVEWILERLSGGWDTSTLIEAYPHLSTADIQAALAFAAELMRDERYIAAGKAVA
ncbi:MAG: DUF433 domain-containing protein [Aquimonas sp.]|nr:DUF433 domain-containing protein [Aquimonas sp.]